jgi:hypothetical protein
MSHRERKRSWHRFPSSVGASISDGFSRQQTARGLSQNRPACERLGLFGIESRALLHLESLEQARSGTDTLEVDKGSAALDMPVTFLAGVARQLEDHTSLTTR